MPLHYKLNAKNQAISVRQYFTKLEKPNLGPILALLVRQPQTKTEIPIPHAKK